MVGAGQLHSKGRRGLGANWASASEPPPSHLNNVRGRREIISRRGRSKEAIRGVHTARGRRSALLEHRIRRLLEQEARPTEHPLRAQAVEGERAAAVRQGHALADLMRDAIIGAISRTQTGVQGGTQRGTQRCKQGGTRWHSERRAERHSVALREASREALGGT